VLLDVTGRHGHDGMVAGLKKYTISAYHHWSCEIESLQGVLDTTLCDKVCQWFALGMW
jgi:hypothetical protein